MKMVRDAAVQRNTTVNKPGLNPISDYHQLSRICPTGRLLARSEEFWVIRDGVQDQHIDTGSQVMQRCRRCKQLFLNLVRPHWVAPHLQHQWHLRGTICYLCTFTLQLLGHLGMRSSCSHKHQTEQVCLAHHALKRATWVSNRSSRQMSLRHICLLDLPEV